MREIQSSSLQKEWNKLLQEQASSNDEISTSTDQEPVCMNCVQIQSCKLRTLYKHSITMVHISVTERVTEGWL